MAGIKQEKRNVGGATLDDSEVEAPEKCDDSGDVKYTD